MGICLPKTAWPPTEQYFTLENPLTITSKDSPTIISTKLATNVDTGKTGFVISEPDDTLIINRSRKIANKAFIRPHACLIEYMIVRTNEAPGCLATNLVGPGICLNPLTYCV